MYFTCDINTDFPKLVHNYECVLELTESLNILTDILIDDH